MEGSILLGLLGLHPLPPHVPPGGRKGTGSSDGEPLTHALTAGGDGAAEEARVRRVDRHLPAVCVHRVCEPGEASVLVHRHLQTSLQLLSGGRQVSHKLFNQDSFVV